MINGDVLHVFCLSANGDYPSETRASLMIAAIVRCKFHCLFSPVHSGRSLAVC